MGAQGNREGKENGGVSGVEETWGEGAVEGAMQQEGGIQSRAGLWGFGGQRGVS
jgi:hypothetical protein